MPEDCTVHVLSEPGEDGVAALVALAEAAAPDATPALIEASRPASSLLVSLTRFRLVATSPP